MGSKNKFAVLVLLFALITSSSYAQYLPKKIKQQLTNCYDSNFIGYNKPFKTTGYYLSKLTLQNCSYCGTDTFDFIIILYEDGSYVENAHGIENLSFEEFSKYLASTNAHQRLEELGVWGIYRIEGNEIIAQSVFDPGYKLQLNKWSICETHYKIIDNDMLQEIYRECWDGTGKAFGLPTGEYSKFKHIPGKFVPFSGLPSPDSWLKKVDGIRCK